MEHILYFFKKKWVRLGSLVLILIILLGAISTRALFSTHADAGGFQPQNSTEKEVTGRITNYSGDDQNQYPPNDNIDWAANNGYPTIHTSQTLNSGVGTYANPIDVAINSKTAANGDVPADSHFQIGEKFYIPQLHLYFIAEDSCNVTIASGICTNNGEDTYDGSELHMDLFNNDIKSAADYQVQQDCENGSGPASGKAQVIANPVDGYPMPAAYPHGTPLFDPVTKTCIGKALWAQYSNWSFADLYANMHTGTLPTGGSPGSPIVYPDPGVTPTDTVVASPTSTATAVANPTSTATAVANPTSTATTVANPTSTATTVTNGQTQSIDDSAAGSGDYLFNYIGAGWKHCRRCDHNNEGFYNQSNSWDNKPGDKLQITFTGTQILFYGVAGPDHGIAQISIDGSTPIQIDFYAANEAGGTLLYTSPPLDQGSHTFVLTVSGTQNASATSNYVNPDAVKIVVGP